MPVAKKIGDKWKSGLSYHVNDQLLIQLNNSSELGVTNNHVPFPKLSARHTLILLENSFLDTLEKRIELGSWETPAEVFNSIDIDKLPLDRYCPGIFYPVIANSLAAYWVDNGKPTFSLLIGQNDGNLFLHTKYREEVCLGIFENSPVKKTAKRNPSSNFYHLTGPALKYVKHVLSKHANVSYNMDELDVHEYWPDKIDRLASGSKFCYVPVKREGNNSTERRLIDAIYNHHLPNPPNETILVRPEDVLKELRNDVGGVFVRPCTISDGGLSTGNSFSHVRYLRGIPKNHDSKP